MSNVRPEVIWLQTVESETTWCQDKITDEDTKYVRADVVEASQTYARSRADEAEGLKAALINLMAWVKRGADSGDWGNWEADDVAAYLDAKAALARNPAVEPAPEHAGRAVAGQALGGGTTDRRLAVRVRSPGYMGDVNGAGCDPDTP